MGENNRHHLLWPRVEWSTGSVKELRQFWYLVVEIPKDSLHRVIHDELSGIPPIDGSNAKKILKILKILSTEGIIHHDDPIEKRLAILISLSNYLSPETVKALKEQLSIVRNFRNAEPS